MMETTSQAVKAIRRVLSEDVKREEIPSIYSPALQAFIAATILHGADLTVEELQRVPYKYLLWYLVVVPAMPPRGWSDAPYDSYPEWRKKLSYDTLLRQSLRCGLHESPGRGKRAVTLTPNSLIQSVLDEDKSFPKLCRAWYEEALSGIKEHER